VPGGYTLDRLSRIVQLIFGWRGHHLHSFEAGGRQYGEPDPLTGGGPGDPADHDPTGLDLDDELDARLDGVARLGDRFSYVYDFTDWWEHEIVVEKVTSADPEERYPICVAGERAGPPEDLGGPAAYAEILALLADPTRPDPAGARAWLAGFDPERCEPGPLSTLLRRMA
jgi:hypothetical protein